MLRWWLGHDSPAHLSGPYQKLREYCEANDKHPRSVLEDMVNGRVDLPDASAPAGAVWEPGQGD